MIAWVFVVVAFHASCGKFCKLSVHFIFAWYLLRFRSCCNFRKCILLACFPTLSVSFLHNLGEFFLREKTYIIRCLVINSSLSQSAPVLKTWVGLRPWKNRVKKIGSGFFLLLLLFIKRRGSLASSLVNHKLQAKDMVQTLKQNRVEATLYSFFKFQILTNYQVDLIN